MFGGLQVVGFIIVLSSVSYSTQTVGSSDMLGGLSTRELALPYRADFFHLFYALASMYIGMLFTNWSVSPSTESFQLDQGWISTWVKMAFKWLCELLYMWTVVAPAVLRNRSFASAYPEPSM